MTLNIGHISTELLTGRLDLDQFDLRDGDLTARIIQLDVIEGLQPAFVPEGAGLNLLEGYEPMAGRDQQVSALPWVYNCRHVAPLGQVADGDPRFGVIPATDLEVEIEGVTLLRAVDGQDGEEVEIRRYVDWNLVLIQLGVTASLRAGGAPEEPGEN